MSLADLLKLALDSILRARVRSSMLLLAMGIGVAAVIVLTGLGEAARRYVEAFERITGRPSVADLRPPQARTEAALAAVGL